MNAGLGGAAHESPRSATQSDRRSARAAWLLDEHFWRRAWFAPVASDPARFVDPGGGPPPLHLIADRRGAVTPLLRLCEDRTGLLVAPTDPRLPAAGIWIAPVCAEHTHQEACRGGDFRPGQPIRLLRVAPGAGNPRLAITADALEAPVAAYIAEPAAQALIAVLDTGRPLTGVSLRGTRAGETCRSIAVLIAAPDVIAHLLSPRPTGLPEPMHLRMGTAAAPGGVTMGAVHYRPPRQQR